MATPEPFLPLVPSFAVVVNGQKLERELAWQITGVTVEDRVDTPSMFTLDVASDDLGARAAWLDDDKRFAIGDEIGIRLGYRGTGLQSLIDGEVTALEIEFTAQGLPRMSVRGYDCRHRLQRGRKVRTFLKQTDADIAKHIASEAGISARVAGGGTHHDYIIQANQTDLAFLQERARRIDHEISVEGRTLYFRPTDHTAAPALSLSIDKSDLSEFRAQLSTAEQVSKVTVRGNDIKEKKTLASDATGAAPMGGQSSAPALVKKAFGEAQELLISPPVASQEEASTLAKARLDTLALRLVRGEGVGPGRPEIRAGKVIEIKGAGKRFSGPYYVTAANHSYGVEGYTTHFIAWRNAT
jgi:phage protein D